MTEMTAVSHFIDREIFEKWQQYCRYYAFGRKWLDCRHNRRFVSLSGNYTRFARGRMSLHEPGNVAPLTGRSPSKPGDKFGESGLFGDAATFDYERLVEQVADVHIVRFCDQYGLTFALEVLQNLDHTAGKYRRDTFTWLIQKQ